MRSAVLHPNVVWFMLKSFQTEVSADNGR